jgi:hypothetical protein
MSLFALASGTLIADPQRRSGTKAAFGTATLRVANSKCRASPCRRGPVQLASRARPAIETASAFGAIEQPPGLLAKGDAADITTAVRALRRAPRMIVAQARAPPGAPKAPSETLERRSNPSRWRPDN